MLKQKQTCKYQDCWEKCKTSIVKNPEERLNIDLFAFYNENIIKFAYTKCRFASDGLPGHKDQGVKERPIFSSRGKRRTLIPKPEKWDMPITEYVISFIS